MTKKRDYRLYVSDILKAITSIESFTEGMNFEDFLRDERTKSAVVWKISVIGEATKHLPRHLRQKYNHIPWNDMTKMRDKVSHAYFGIRYEIVWNVIKERLPNIKQMIQTMFTDLHSGSPHV